MGLDITVYPTIRAVSPNAIPRDPEGEPDWDVMWSAGITTVYRHEQFARSTRGLPDSPYVQSEGKWSFRAGSYSGYSMFREELARKMLDVEVGELWDSRELYQDLPFFELLNFSDCEGSIGSEACADLAKDFEDHYERAKEVWAQDEHMLRLYETWMKAFQQTANTGMVDFH